MKGGKKKIAGGENGEAASAGEDVAPGDVEVGDRPKLPQGFYEIEAIRKRRTRKGKAQYLIKWRGYPDTANTWEPKKHLLACLDVVEAYEESLRSGKHSTVPGKRKSMVTHSQPETQKQQQSSPTAATYNVPAVRVRIIDNPLPMAPPGGPSNPASQRDGAVGPFNSVEGSSQAMGIGFGAVRTQDKDDKVGELDGTPDRLEKYGSVNLAKEQPKIDDVEQGESGRRIGSRRRKSGPVKKFTISSMPRAPIDAQNEISLSMNGGCGEFESQGSKVLDSMGNDLNQENRFDFSERVPTINRIVKPMCYSMSTLNNACDASVTFLAVRSDGREVLVDNKFLKANNPLLLINFYEQHLNYHPVQ